MDVSREGDSLQCHATATLQCTCSVLRLPIAKLPTAGLSSQPLCAGVLDDLAVLLPPEPEVPLPVAELTRVAVVVALEEPED